MALKCPQCHFDNPDTQRFCGECGTQLGEPRAAKLTKPDVTETLQSPVRELTIGSTSGRTPTPACPKSKTPASVSLH